MPANAPRRIVREITRITAPQNEPLCMTKKKVAAYARVSTEKEQQEDSFERQVEYYTGYIQRNSDWEFVEVYADPGITGTRAEKRPNFMRMIADCRAGKIDKILVKSISRFARNTVDALNYIRELREMGVGVFFENENIDTLTQGGEVLLTILAAMAEQESRTISTNIRWAFQRKFQKGEIILNTGIMLGYRKNADGEILIYEPEAEIIRRIYREYVAGVSIPQIARGLERDGIKTRFGKDKWQVQVITSILTNEKYTGNAILGKTYKPDVLSKKRLKNDGEKAPMYYAENSHPAIVSMEIFEMAKAEMLRRKDAKDDATGCSRYSSKYPFSGLLICGECGSKLRRHVRTVGTGKKVPAWGCATRIKDGREVCDSHHVNEDVMERTYTEAVHKLVDGAGEIIAAIKENAGEMMSPENSEAMEAVDQQIFDVQEAVLNLHKRKRACEITSADYTAQLQVYSDQLHDLETQQEALHTAATRYTEIKTWLDAFEESIESGDIFSATEGLIMKRLVDKIVVYDDGIEVRLKCGASATQEYVA